jgi:hypothetical protein
MLYYDTTLPDADDMRQQSTARRALVGVVVFAVIPRFVVAESKITSPQAIRGLDPAGECGGQINQWYILITQCTTATSQQPRLPVSTHPRLSPFQLSTTITVIVLTGPTSQEHQHAVPVTSTART